MAGYRKRRQRLPVGVCQCGNLINGYSPMECRDCYERGVRIGAKEVVYNSVFQSVASKDHTALRSVTCEK